MKTSRKTRQAFRRAAETVPASRIRLRIKRTERALLGKLTPRYGCSQRKFAFKVSSISNETTRYCSIPVDMYRGLSVPIIIHLALLIKRHAATTKFVRFLLSSDPNIAILSVGLGTRKIEHIMAADIHAFPLHLHICISIYI